MAQIRRLAVKRRETPAMREALSVSPDRRRAARVRIIGHGRDEMRISHCDSGGEPIAGCNRDIARDQQPPFC
jgi:hypothetical protein